MEMKLWLKGPGPTGIYNDDIIFRVELEEPEDESKDTLFNFGSMILSFKCPASEEEQTRSLAVNVVHAIDIKLTNKYIDSIDKTKYIVLN